MSGVKSALPTHLSPNAEDNGFEQRHHGKTRSHMASDPLSSSLNHSVFPPFYDSVRDAVDLSCRRLSITGCRFGLELPMQRTFIPLLAELCSC